MVAGLATEDRRHSTGTPTGCVVPMSAVRTLQRAAAVI